MTHDRDFALVVEAARLGDLGRAFPAPYGICTVEEDSCRIQFAQARDIVGFVGSLPCTPFCFGDRPARPSLDDETRAYEAVVSEALRLSASSRLGPLPGYTPSGSRYPAAVRVKGDGHFLDVTINASLAEAAGWRPGDRISVAFTHDGQGACLHAADDGAKLAFEEMTYATMTLDRLLPCPSPVSTGQWSFCDAHLIEGRVTFAMPVEQRVATPDPSLIERTEERPVRRMFKPWLSVMVFLAGAAAFWLFPSPL